MSSGTRTAYKVSDSGRRPMMLPSIIAMMEDGYSKTYSYTGHRMEKGVFATFGGHNGEGSKTTATLRAPKKVSTGTITKTFNMPARHLILLSFMKTIEEMGHLERGIANDIERAWARGVAVKEGQEAFEDIESKVRKATGDSTEKSAGVVQEVALLAHNIGSDLSASEPIVVKTKMTDREYIKLAEEAWGADVVAELQMYHTVKELVRQIKEGLKGSQ